MLKAIGYVRVSSEEQAREGVSMAAQEAKIRSYCELYDLDLVHLIVDAGQSAKTLNRPGLQEALTMLDEGQAGALVIAKLDRLTRSVADWGTLIDRYFAKRHALLSVADQIDTRTAAGRLVLNVLVSVAQWEREAIGERTSSALAFKKEQGEHVGGVPFGYQVRGTKLAEVEAQANAINLILDLRSRGMTLRAIAAELTTLGIQTQRGGRWQANTIKAIIDREGR